MTNQEYIHINEAVKKWEKTRQTFYNYIHKGLVRTKKINNKVYLYHDDVEQLMNGFIPDAVEPTKVQKTSEAQEESVPTVKETSEEKIPQEIVNIQKDMARLHKQYYTLKDDIINTVHSTKHDLLFDTQRLSKQVEQNIHQHIDTTTQQKSYEKFGLLEKIEKIAVQTKKQSFWIGYCSFVVVNMMMVMWMI